MTRSTLRTIVLVAAVVLVVGAAVTASRLLRPGTDFSARFPSAVGLYPGSDVQVLGVKVGTVTAVEPAGATVTVRMRLDHGRKVDADTGAVIVAPTLVSDRYVQLTDPFTGGRALREGAQITKTAVPVEIDKLYDSLVDIGTKLGPDGANRNGALSQLLTTVARNISGEGTDINRAISGFSKASATVSGFDQDLFATVRNLDTINTTLLQKDKGVADANKQLAAVSEYLAADRGDLATALQELGGAMATLEGFIKDNRAALTSSVEGLKAPTQVLVDQRKSLTEAVRTIPLVLQNLLGAYDGGSNTIQGRGNLNELTLGSTDGNSARTSADAPPLLLPGLGGTGGGQ